MKVTWNDVTLNPEKFVRPQPLKRLNPKQYTWLVFAELMLKIKRFILTCAHSGSRRWKIVQYIEQELNWDKLRHSSFSWSLAQTREKEKNKTGSLRTFVFQLWDFASCPDLLSSDQRGNSWMSLFCHLRLLQAWGSKANQPATHSPVHQCYSHRVRLPANQAVTHQRGSKKEVTSYCWMSRTGVGGSCCHVNSCKRSNDVMVSAKEFVYVGRTDAWLTLFSQGNRTVKISLWVLILI